MSVFVLLLAVLVAVAGEPAAAPELTVELREIAYAQRIEYVLGDGERPFADEDQRRLQVVAGVRVAGRVALLGWGALAMEPTASDRDEPLAPIVPAGQAEGVFATTHERQADPALPLPGILLPPTRGPCAALRRFAGSVEVRYATDPPIAVRFRVADLPPGQERAIAGLDGGSIALVEAPGADGRVQARFSAAAYLALQDLAFFDAAGAELPGRNRRSEQKDGQGLVTLVAKAAPAELEVRFYPRILRRTVVFAFPDLALGLAAPGRDDLRGRPRTGADGL